MSSPMLDRAGPVSPEVARVAAQAEADLTALIGELGAQPDAADRATAEFLDRITGQALARGSGKTMSIMVRLPLLVHGAHTGDPGPAKLVSIVHILWWAAARFLDDLVDQAESRPSDPIVTNKGILAAMMGGQLPAGPAGRRRRCRPGDDDAVARGVLPGLDRRHQRAVARLRRLGRGGHAGVGTAVLPG